MQTTKPSSFVTRKICRFLADGHSRETAASLAGISALTFDQWQHDFSEFLLFIEQAEAKYQLRLLSAINRAANQRQWRVAAWLLERRWPEEFGKRHRMLIPTQGKDKPRVEDYIDAINKALGVGRDLEPTRRPGTELAYRNARNRKSKAIELDLDTAGFEADVNGLVGSIRLLTCLATHRSQAKPATHFVPGKSISRTDG